VNESMEVAVPLDVRIALDTRVLRAIPLAVCLLEADRADSRSSTLEASSTPLPRTLQSAQIMPWPRGTA
jgi:hypothetical protein